ncbi:MAG TPA: pyruvate kinase [Bacteroidetes bacterium]|nr:pyruvate kinase [Bacteroidota bacterium]
MKNTNLLKKTKIIATLGPASEDPEIMKKMILEGVNVFRLNFSHGTYEQKEKSIQTIKELRKELNIPVGILADLQGPKLRIGEIKNNLVQLKDGEFIEITNTACLGDDNRVYLSYPTFAEDVEPGDTVLVDDGKIKLEVTETNQKDKVIARIIHGGFLSSHKGVNLPDTKISLPSLTEKDLEDTRFILDHEIDWIALSFVRKATDILDLHDLLKKHKGKVDPWIIAKIEKPEALKEIDQIIDLSRGIMIARGDLGVEVSFSHVPIIQKEIIQKCIEHAKPVIIATQMMESMIDNFRPTRAEATDVANAVLDGGDCLMLSGETSVGKYPVEVVQNMHSIISFTEQHGFHYLKEHPPVEFSKTYLPESVCYQACKMAEQTHAASIITFTHSGSTALYIASHRPDKPIYAITNNKFLLNKLSMVYGVFPIYMEKVEKIEDAIRQSISYLKKHDYLHDEDVVVHVGSTPINLRGKTNMLKLSYV